MTAYKLAPYNDEYIALLGTVYLGLGQNTTARGICKKALRISPDNATALEGLKNAGKDETIIKLTPSPEKVMADTRAVKDFPNDKIDHFINALRFLVKSGYRGRYRNTKPREF